jgi:protein-S-isoprenylcysteine O-methyltransferase Ste14
MPTSAGSQQPTPSPGRLTIQVGRRAITGPWAVAVLLLLLGLVAVLLVWARPSLRILFSGALWVLLILYWSAAAKSSAPRESAESAASRALHTWLLDAALLLLFVPIPGLRSRARDHQLMQSGPYHWVRHPIYTARHE